jgi:hypothetical protein
VAKSMTDQITATLTTLTKSKFRSRSKLTDKDRRYIQNKGIDATRSYAIDFMTIRIAPATAHPEK